MRVQLLLSYSGLSGSLRGVKEEFFLFLSELRAPVSLRASVTFPFVLRANGLFVDDALGSPSCRVRACTVL